MNDSVPAMLDRFHLHKLPSHGRCSGICLNPATGFCLDSTKMVLNTTVMFYHFQIKYKNILKIPPQFKKKMQPNRDNQLHSRTTVIFSELSHVAAFSRSQHRNTDCIFSKGILTNKATNK